MNIKPLEISFVDITGERSLTFIYNVNKYFQFLSSLKLYHFTTEALKQSQKLEKLMTVAVW